MKFINFSKIIIPKFFKNFLIFFPVLISSKELSSQIIQNLFLGFFIFCTITLVVYFTNDYFDREIDKSNKLKNKKNLSFDINFKSILALNIFLFLFLYTISLFNFFDYSLLAYIFLFYFYTIYGKKIKFLDLILLNSFYFLRLIYGCNLIDVNISLWFIIFFFSLFFMLAIFKRYIQINVNKLDKDNLIIPYSLKDLKIFRYLIILFFIITTLIMTLFIYQENFYKVEFLSSENTKLIFNKIYYLSILIIYIINIFYIYKKIIYNKINKDIFEYVSKNKFNILSAVLVLLLLIMDK